MELNKKQLEIIKGMKSGKVLRVIIRQGNRVNKYYLDSSRPLKRSNIVHLSDLGLISFKQDSFCSGEYVLTELAKGLN